MRARFSLVTLLALLASGPTLAADASNGQTLYTANCASCHGGGNGNWSLSNIQSAIQGNRGGMSRLSTLSSSDLQDIVAYLSSASTGSTATTTATNTTTTTTPPASVSAPAPDTLFAALETAFPNSFGSHDATTVIAGYSIRYYPTSGLYLGVLANQLYLYDSNRSSLGVIALGSTVAWASELASSSAVAASNSLSSQLAAILAGTATRMTALFGGPDGSDHSPEHGREHGHGGRN
jgi:hypothetical protein